MPSRDQELFAKRVAEKAASRAADARALASRRKSRKRLRKENGYFAELASAPIEWDAVKRLY